MADRAPLSAGARNRVVTAALVVLAVAALSVGIPATFTPHAFYTGYPFVGHWVDRLPPFNQHLTTDVGEFELAFGLLFLWCAWSRRAVLLVPVCLAWALSQTAHAIYHVTHLSGFPTADAIEEILGFVVLVGLALLVAWLVRGDFAAAQAGSEGHEDAG